MPDFAYVARDFAGQKITGVISAGNAREAQASLAEKSLFPVSIEARTSAAQTFRGRRVKAQLVATTYGQLAGLLRSGVPLLTESRSSSSEARPRSRGRNADDEPDDESEHDARLCGGFSGVLTPQGDGNGEPDAT